MTLAEILDAPGGLAPSAARAPSLSTIRCRAASWIEDRYTTELLENADVLLAVGTSMGEVTSNYFTFRPRGRLIHIDAEPRVLEANHPGPGHPRRRRTGASGDRQAGLGQRGAKHGATVASELRKSVRAQAR